MKNKKIREIAEMLSLRYLMQQFPTGTLSVVSDTYDLWDVCKPNGVLSKLKDEILARDGKIVIRPDSGDPVDIICGYYIVDHRDGLVTARGSGDKWIKSFTLGEPTIEEYKKTSKYKGVIELLWDLFGGTVNEQGYKVLDTHIGAIYGDSITTERAEEICKRLEAKGFASTNIVLGVGSFTYQYNTRDTFGFAMKATYCEVSSKEEKCPFNFTSRCTYDRCDCKKKIEGREIFKDPITDDGTKSLLKGC